MRADYADIDAAVKRPGFLKQLQRDQPTNHAILRDTCSMTRLSASDKVNVVPPEASLEMDCRLLPDQSPEEFLTQLAAIIDDPSIKVKILVNFAPAVSSVDTDLFRTIETIIEKYYPGAPVVPSVQPGFTDSHFFRDLGIISYGYSPIMLHPREFGGVHGNNERISVENLETGSESLIQLLRDFTRD